MEEKTSVPYIVYESEQARSERHIKRLIIALMISVVLIFTSNALWLYYMAGFDIETYDYTQDGMGVNIIGNRNGVDYDVPEVDSCENDSQEKGSQEIGSS